MSERDEFEAAFPVPQGMVWSEKDQRYVIDSDDDFWWDQDEDGPRIADQYIGKWEGWKAARQSSEADGGYLVVNEVLADGCEFSWFEKVEDARAFAKELHENGWERVRLHPCALLKQEGSTNG